MIVLQCLRACSCLVRRVYGSGTCPTRKRSFTTATARKYSQTSRPCVQVRACARACVRRTYLYVPRACCDACNASMLSLFLRVISQTTRPASYSDRRRRHVAPSQPRLPAPAAAVLQRPPATTSRVRVPKAAQSQTPGVGRSCAHTRRPIRPRVAPPCTQRRIHVSYSRKNRTQTI